MTPAAGAGVPGPELGALLAWLALERLAELLLSARHERVLRARGAVERGRGHFPLLVAVHTAYPLLLAFEVLALGARPGPEWWAWLLLLVLAQALRAWTIATLGVRWTVRILVLPGAPPIRHGPYRFLSHPNYLAVATELLSGAMLFGAWRTALLITAINWVALAIRIRAEEGALAWASRQPASGASPPPPPAAGSPSRPPARAPGGPPA